MIKKVIKKIGLKDSQGIKEDLQYWLRLKPEERVAAVDHLRFQSYGYSIRLQRSARVIQQISS